jgi:bifunctional non-homologous end joining protein LigD
MARSPVAAVQPSGPLATYWAKRNFAATTEPRGAHAETVEGRTFVVQKHAASRLHYDLRLELGGVLVSWAVPKGPSCDPADKRIAVHVEDHPLSYASFEGTIPPKQYGAGTVIVWDNGTWEPVGDPVEGLARGKLLFKLHGQKLKGLWELVRIAKPGDKQDLWILFKKRGDAHARPKAEYDVVRALPDSVIARPLKRVDDRQAIPGAVKAKLPEKLSPQLATLATAIPVTGEWLSEIKFDGYRLMARIDGGQARLFTRGGHDWSDKMPGLVTQLQGLGVNSAWLDGEIVVLNEAGRPDFNRLQKAFDRKGGAAGIDYFLFDLPYFEGYDLRGVPLIERRRLLKALLDDRATPHVRYSADFAGDPAAVLQSACRMQLEGIIVKRADAPYASRRTETWLKLKCKLRQEFDIAGYTDRSDGAAQIGSLLLGVYDDDGRLVSVGSVGTGWDADEAARLKKTLAAIEAPQAPFAAGAPAPGRWSKRRGGSERWVRPELVAEVEYAEKTPDGQIRHATYVALRSDKAAKTVRDEPTLAAPPRRAAAVAVSHPDRVIDGSTGSTKLDLVRYYESVADYMLPHLKGRPCSLVRGPAGVGGQLFFQKHAERTPIPGVKNLDPALWPDHDALLEVPTALALASAAQLNVIEFHTWNSTTRNIARPDRMVYDLDPGEGTPWAQVQEAAMLVRGFLQELGLRCWLKTSGGKGLHVVVPLAPSFDYDTVKGFSKAVVEHLARVVPSRFVARSGPSNRVGKLFVDYLRNGHGATTVAAFSARARPGLGVSMPVSWEDLPTLKGGAQWSIATAREHLSFQQADPWADYWTSKQKLGRAMRTLGYAPAKAASPR